MIIVRLIGGLGNQLFEYALARRLSFERGVSLKLDLSWFKDQPERPFRLDRFNIKAVPADPYEIEKLFHLERKDLHSRLIRRLERFLPYYRRHVIYENNSGFDPSILKAPVSVYLDGYWQSPKYFSAIETVLRQDFELREPLRNERLLDLMKEVETGNSVSLHIRRGDYVQDPKTAAVHNTCPISYYQESLKLLSENESNLRVYVFSDDIQWAKQNLHTNFPTQFVSGQLGMPDYVELELMRRCKNHIIANSSFSWWAAWLAANPGKTIIAPRTWFVSREARDLIPPEWRII